MEQLAGPGELAHQGLPALYTSPSTGLANQKEWHAWGKEGMRPANVPSNPQTTYTHDRWHVWGHLLGTGNQCTRIQPYLPFEDALAVSQSLGLANQEEWKAWWKQGMRHHTVPGAPDKVYTHDMRPSCSAHDTDCPPRSSMKLCG